jgi:hypothetical protein
MECNIATIDFLLPIGTQKPQYVKFVIYPECFTGMNLSESDVWGIDLYCSGGANQIIDFKPSMCDNGNPYVTWVNLTLLANQSRAYKIYNDVVYEDYWCAFRRTNGSVENYPIEFLAVVDSLGYTSPQEDNVFYFQKLAGGTITSGIREIFTINMNIFQIGFYLLTAIVVIVGFVALIGGIPLMIKWIIKKVTT